MNYLDSIAGIKKLKSIMNALHGDWKICLAERKLGEFDIKKVNCVCNYNHYGIYLIGHDNLEGFVSRYWPNKGVRQIIKLLSSTRHIVLGFWLDGIWCDIQEEDDHSIRQKVKAIEGRVDEDKDKIGIVFKYIEISDALLKTT